MMLRYESEEKNKNKPTSQWVHEFKVTPIGTGIRFRGWEGVIGDMGNNLEELLLGNQL